MYPLWTNQTKILEIRVRYSYQRVSACCRHYIPLPVYSVSSLLKRWIVSHGVDACKVEGI